MRDADAVIRTATLADAAPLFELHQQSVRAFCAGAYSPANLGAWFHDRTPDIYRPWLEEGRVWLAESGGGLVGFCGAVPGEVTLLYIRPDQAGRGLGTRLFHHACAQAAVGYEGPLAVTALLNAASFYERHGFVAVGESHFTRGDPLLYYRTIKMLRPPP